MTLQVKLYGDIWRVLSRIFLDSFVTFCDTIVKGVPCDVSKLGSIDPDIDKGHSI